MQKLEAFPSPGFRDNSRVLMVVQLRFPSPEEAQGNLNVVIQKTTPTVSLNVLRTGAEGQKGAATYTLATMRHVSLTIIINMED